MGGPEAKDDRRPLVDLAGTVGDLHAVEGEPPSVVVLDHPGAPLGGEDGHPPTADLAQAARTRRAHGTIFEMGSSMMSVAPRSFSSGMRVLMVDLGTTASRA